MKMIFFSKQADFRKWLEKNHKKETELLVGFYKKGSGKPSMTWPESVDEALCFGWIDGIRKSIDDESYSIRFTPRKAKSIWSAINIKKVAQLKKLGLMKAEGLAAFEKKEDHRSKLYSHENAPAILATAYEKKFKANKKAWAYFKSQAPSYQKTAIHLVMTAKQEATQLRRLDNLIQSSAIGEKIKSISWKKKE
jgi:uncharacterized protein YdeI (YjbR/CyaY-like superfamily)